VLLPSDVTKIKRVGVVDDNADIRETLSEELVDADFEPHIFPGPYDDVQQLCQALVQNTDATVCDHHLSPHRLASFTGAELVSCCNVKKRPSVLTTTYSKADADQIRLYLRHIPVRLTQDQTNPDTIRRGWEWCLNEFNGKYRQERKPWRTLVRIADIDDGTSNTVLYVIVPAWSSVEVIRILKRHLPVLLQEKAQVGFRFHANVNLGTENQEDMYFDQFQWSE
jgi:CheY-like chemotaxis protein